MVHNLSKFLCRLCLFLLLRHLSLSDALPSTIASSIDAASSSNLSSNSPPAPTNLPDALSSTTASSTGVASALYLLSNSPPAPTHTNSFFQLAFALSSIAPTPSHPAWASHHPRPPPRDRFHGHPEPIVVAGITLLALLILAVLITLVQFARSYWRTPSRDATAVDLARRRLQLEMQWRENEAMFSGPSLPAPPYFPRPPSYRDVESADKDAYVPLASPRSEMDGGMPSPRSPAGVYRHSI
ncbi:hypothetical protein C8R44DRAFT_814562 [Mycena epipterygia]|nr:hypothetical protein C8R44DRAFT_814562 [Mycena epipterygia]